MKLCMGCMNQIDEKMTVCPHCGFNEATLKQESYYLNPGTVIGGKYIVGKALSYGGYTVTYLGMDAEKNRKVMIKEYLPSDFSTRSEGDTEVTIYSGDACEQFEQGLTTFLNEANRIEQLQNPQGIMRVYDCVAENDTGYVISEYLEGKTLKQIMEDGKRFSVQEAKEFVCRILEGLRQVHPLDIIHCDISPETIFVTNTGEIKLLDFGATRYVTTANSKSLAIILKQGFAPEEQYRSRGERGPWTDVYALGAVMYYMITGVVPVESVDRALMDELKEPSKLGVQIPANIENALMNALNVYQNDRTPSAEVFYRELNSPQVTRIQVKKQKYETGKFPTWAKFLVAGMLCVVVAGGVVIGLRSRNRKLETDSEKCVDNIVGMTEEKARETLNNSGLNLKVDKVVFDKDEQQDGGKVLTQEPPAGNELPNDNEVKVTIRSKEKCYYSDILSEAGENVDVNLLVEKFGIDNELLSPSDKDKKNQKYYDLYQIKLKDGKTLSVDDLKKGENIITFSDIKKVSYYISPFMYVKELRDYEGDNINGIKFEKYIYEDKKLKPIGSKDVPPISEDYYSFEREEGYIVKQMKAKRKSYNSREDKGALFLTVKKRINTSQSWDDIKKDLKNCGFSEEKGNLTVHGSGSQIRIDPPEANKDDEDSVKDGCFTKKATIKITLIQKPIPAPSMSENSSSTKKRKPLPQKPDKGDIIPGKK